MERQIGGVVVTRSIDVLVHNLDYLIPHDVSRRMFDAA
jgi:hypothetical protein